MSQWQFARVCLVIIPMIVVVINILDRTRGNGKWICNAQRDTTMGARNQSKNQYMYIFQIVEMSANDVDIGDKITI